MPTTSQLSGLESIEDPRRNNHCHKLGDILFIAGGAVIGGAESWNDIKLDGQSKFDWLKPFSLSRLSFPRSGVGMRTANVRTRKSAFPRRSVGTRTRKLNYLSTNQAYHFHPK